MSPEFLSRVLIVEDDDLVRTVHRALIEETPGFQVVSAVGTLAQAQRDLADLSPDLLLVDIYLPDGSGLDWIQGLPRTSAAPDVIMITAANDLPTVQHAVLSGVLDFLIKPFHRARLQTALQRHQERRRPQLLAHLTQQGVDRLLRHDPVTHLPKGIDAATLQKVRETLNRTDEALSAELVGQRIGVSRITAWRYLEYLATVHLIEMDIEYRPTGRPLKLYRRLRAES
jgi:two-component system CitB family response regulator